jgi:mevalonate kinase
MSPTSPPLSRKIRCSAKTVLLGEWGVLSGGEAIAIALAGYHFNLTFEASQKNQAGIFISHSPDAPFLFEKSIADSPTDPYFCRAHDLLGELKGMYPEFARASEYAQFSFERNWPLHYGLGSSSALALTLTALAQKPIPAPTIDEPMRAHIFKTALKIQKSTFAPRSSGVDLACQTWGGLISYSCAGQGTEFNFRIRNLCKPGQSLPEELALIFGNQKLNTQEAIASEAVDLQSRRDLASAATHFLKNSNWERSIQEHAEILAKTSSVPPNIKKLMEELTRSKLVSAVKTTGAGGGDALLVWANSEQRRSLKQWCADHTLTLHHPIICGAPLQELPA